MRLLIPLLAFSLLTTAAQAQTPQTTQARVVQVSGQGEASIAPDRAQLSMAIEARSADLKLAETKVNDGTRAVQAELKGLGIKKEDITTAGYSVNPEYDWVDNQQRFRAYFARREILVAVRNLDQVGDVLLKLTKAGVNQINPPVLESSQIKQNELQALAKAVEDASAQARVVAAGLAMKLGPVRTLNASSQALPPPLPMPRMMAMKAAAADSGPEMSGNEQTGFSAGMIRSTATVTAEFELLP